MSSVALKYYPHDWWMKSDGKLVVHFTDKRGRAKNLRIGTVLRSSYTSKHPVGSEGVLSPVIKMETKEGRVWGLDPIRFCVDGSKCHTLLKDVYAKLSQSKKWAQLSSNSIHCTTYDF